MMSLEIPRFNVSEDSGEIILRALPHHERPAVLFNMLGILALNPYNIASPKEELMYLEAIRSPAQRLVISEMHTDETQYRIGRVVNDFYSHCEEYLNVSERQLAAALDTARDRQDLFDRHA